MRIAVLLLSILSNAGCTGILPSKSPVGELPGHQYAPPTSLGERQVLVARTAHLADSDSSPANNPSPRNNTLLVGSAAPPQRADETFAHPAPNAAGAGSARTPGNGLPGSKTTSAASVHLASYELGAGTPDLAAPGAAAISPMGSDPRLSANGDTEELPKPVPPQGDQPEEELPPGTVMPELQLEEVVNSVYRAYPLLEAALFRREIAAGEFLAAQGAFDLKLRGASDAAPQGYYRNYRQNIWVEQPTFYGGSVFTGYRVGRGLIQPWYGERVTNDGGEFRAGFTMPLLRNVNIDGRRAKLWRSDIEQGMAEQDIRSQRIDFVLAASNAYWKWVAAGRRYGIAQSLLEIARDREGAIRRRVDAGDIEPPVLSDNQRLIVSREAALIEARQRLELAAFALSLYYRNGGGEPVIADYRQLPDFPVPQPMDAERLVQDIETAWSNRPEIQLIDLNREQMKINLTEARNELLPDMQFSALASQDVGLASSSKRDKSQFELEAGLFVDMPVQRRFALGKITANEARLAQLTAVRRMTVERISTEVRNVYAAMIAAYEQVDRARESVELAQELAAIERRRFALGESDLLAVNLREQQAAETEIVLVASLYEYFSSLAAYKAVLALD